MGADLLTFQFYSMHDIATQATKNEDRIQEDEFLTFPRVKCSQLLLDMVLSPESEPSWRYGSCDFIFSAFCTPASFI